MTKTVLPPNSTDLEIALDLNTAKSFDALNPIEGIWSAQLCPIEFLPFLARVFSVDNWDDNWTETIKRRVVASSIFVHRHKGTRAGMEAALNALDLGVQISEWFEHGGDPYSFRVDVSAKEGLTERDFENIKAAIYSTKNARSYLTRLRAFLASSYTHTVTGYMRVGRRITFPPYILKLDDKASIGTSGGCMMITKKIHIGNTHV